jgi:hypothetical protein
MLSFIVFILAAQIYLEQLYSMRLQARFQTTLVLERHDGSAGFPHIFSVPFVGASLLAKAICQLTL